MASNLPAVPEPAEMEGWESDDCAAYLERVVAVTRQMRLVVGAVLSKWRSITADDQKFGELTEPFAAKFDVTKATLWRWRIAAEESLKLPKALDRTKDEIEGGTPFRGRAQSEGHAPSDLPKPSKARATSEGIVDTTSVAASDANDDSGAAAAWHEEVTELSDAVAPEQMRLWPDDPQKAMFASFEVVLAEVGPEKTEKLVRTLLKRVEHAVPKPSTLADVSQATCDHPKAKEDKKPYGVWCGVCRKRIR